MRIIYVVTNTETDYYFNGEDSVPFNRVTPGVAFDVESEANLFADARGEHVYAVNLYEKGETA